MTGDEQLLVVAAIAGAIWLYLLHRNSDESVQQAASDNSNFVPFYLNYNTTTPLNGPQQLGTLPTSSSGYGNGNACDSCSIMGGLN